MENGKVLNYLHEQEDYPTLVAEIEHLRGRINSLEYFAMFLAATLGIVIGGMFLTL